MRAEVPYRSASRAVAAWCLRRAACWLAANISPVLYT